MTLPTNAPALGLRLTDAVLTNATTDTPPLGDTSQRAANMAAIAAAIAALAQPVVRTLQREVTDGTLSALTTDGNTPVLGNRIAIVSGASWLVFFAASAIQVAGSAGTVGDAAEWAGLVAVKNVAAAAPNNVTIPRTWALGVDWASYAANAGIPPFNPGGSSAEAGPAAWRLSFAVDSANNLFLPRFTGEANKTVQVRCTLIIAGRLS